MREKCIQRWRMASCCRLVSTLSPCEAMAIPALLCFYDDVDKTREIFDLLQCALGQVQPELLYQMDKLGRQIWGIRPLCATDGRPTFKQSLWIVARRNRATGPRASSCSTSASASTRSWPSTTSASS